MEFLKNLCETSGNALDVYIAAHGPGFEVLQNEDGKSSARAEELSGFCEIISSSNPSYSAVFDGFDDCNTSVGGRIFVKSQRDCAGIYLDSPAEFSNALEFLKNADAFAIAAEDNPDGNGVMLTVDWRVEDVRF